MRSHAQDEMKALQRINTGTFLVGFLGFLTSYILDFVARIKPGAKQASRVTKLALRALSPHFALARCATAWALEHMMCWRSCRRCACTFHLLGLKRGYALEPLRAITQLKVVPLIADTAEGCRMKGWRLLVGQPSRQVLSVCTAACCRGTYEVVQTYDQGPAGQHPFAWDAGGQYMAWLALQALGAAPAS